MLTTPTADEIAATILEGWDAHHRDFREVSAGARARFERADWPAVRAASTERLDMYDARVATTVALLRQRFPEARVETLWPDVKRAYIPLLYECRQPELAETFFNSVACRVLDRTYYRNEYIFWRPVISTEFLQGEELPAYRCYYPCSAGLRTTLRAILADFGLALPFEDLRRDLRHVLHAVRRQSPEREQRHPNFQIQVLSSLFYRNKAAYVVGRVLNGNESQPFAIPIRHAAEGRSLYLDAMLTRPQDLGTLFTMARAYFMVDMEVPSATVTFLRELVPVKPRAELYVTLGLHKHGKTLFYRDMFEHLSHSSDRFVVAPGARGMVMMVFTLPSFPYVFKLIRDQFEYPKQITAEEVRRKYVFVKRHDRVGRMADTLEYSDVALPLDRFDPALVEVLLERCASRVTLDGERLVLRHVYVQRRMIPLNLYLQDTDERKIRHALRELGRAIRELAEANIFAGDLLPKNFGVTRYGRVVFYDYDDICELETIHPRRLPPPRDFDDELGTEPWHGVGPDDIFPEEFATFMFPPGRQRELFIELNPEVLDPGWWIARQAEARAGVQPDMFPYGDDVRFPTRRAGRPG